MTLKLQHIKNFKECNPKIRPYGDSVIYYQSEDGLDWYDSQDLFQKNTLKIEYNPDGTISRFSYDVSMLSPLGRSVLEVIDTTELRQAYDAETLWQDFVIRDGQVVPKPPSAHHTWSNGTWVITKKAQEKLDAELAVKAADKAKAEVAALRVQCDKDILPLQDALDLAEATPEKIERLKALKRHRMALSDWKYPADIPKVP